jgi:hypothetical protein
MLLVACALAALGQFREPTPFRLRPMRQCWGARASELSYDLVVDLTVTEDRAWALRKSWATPSSAGMCSVMFLYVFAAPSPAVHHERHGDEV